MRVLSVRFLLSAAMIATHPGVAAAQFPPPPPPAGSSPTVQDRWPDPSRPPPDESPRAPAQQPAAKRQPAQARPAQPAPDGDPEQLAAPKPAAPRPPAYVVTCNGVFAKDSTHLKLAIKYDSRNVVFGDVDGPDGSKLKASILFPTDPKRRLEVVWNNDAARTDMAVIAINGKSQWIAPKAVKLGLSLAALEKLNGRPFKLTGFGADGSSVAGWDGGALASLPGGCKVGLRMMPDPKAPQDARSAVSGDKEFLSNDENVRAIKPTVVEILIGY